MIFRLIIIIYCFGLGFPVSADKYFDLGKDDVFVIRSLIHPITVSEIVEKHYVFDAPITSQILNVGVNDMYLVEAGAGKYVLRLSRVEKYLTMTESEFCFELEWLDFLRQDGVPVSYPIRRVDGRLHGLIDTPEGPRYAVLFSYAEGTTDMDEGKAFSLGKILAELHLKSSRFETDLGRINMDVTNLIDLPFKSLKKHLLEDWEDEFAHLEELVRIWRKEILSIKQAEAIYGIIAGDIHGFNQHFSLDEQITLFDFEFCAYGYWIYDVATFRWSRGTDEELWKAFLCGYQSVRVLSDSEVRLLDTFVMVRHLWWMAWIANAPELQHKFDQKFWQNAFSSFHGEFSRKK